MEYKILLAKFQNQYFPDSLVTTKEGFIVPRDMFEDSDQEEMEVEVAEDVAEPEYYLLIFKPVKRLDNALFFQLKYQIKKLLDKEDRHIKSGITETGKFRLIFYGWWDTVEKIQEYTHIKTEFVISDIYYDDNAETLEEIKV